VFSDLALPTRPPAKVYASGAAISLQNDSDPIPHDLRAQSHFPEQDIFASKTSLRAFSGDFDRLRAPKVENKDSTTKTLTDHRLSTSSGVCSTKSRLMPSKIEEDQHFYDSGISPQHTASLPEAKTRPPDSKKSSSNLQTKMKISGTISKARRNFLAHREPQQRPVASFSAHYRCFRQFRRFKAISLTTTATSLLLT
jgi:hypothetical protein